MGRKLADILLIKHNAAIVRLQLPGDEIEQRGFAGAIGSNYGHQLTFVDHQLGTLDLRFHEMRILPVQFQGHDRVRDHDPVNPGDD